MRPVKQVIVLATLLGSVAMAFQFGNLLYGAVALVIGGVLWVVAGVIHSRLNARTRELPIRVKGYLKSSFNVSEDALQRLRFVSKSADYAGKQVNLVRLYDPSLLERTTEVNKYEDMDGDSNAIQFEGRIFKDQGRAIHLTDQRGSA